ncbi:hypothetical protein F5Y15DRAFT_95301 [Xylariaceae sp. FL0016]|nr:hypothetical protein F5Y15DRAFT_95301 [Xylariaceae sp. FL0016]
MFSGHPTILWPRAPLPAPTTVSPEAMAASLCYVLCNTATNEGQHVLQGNDPSICYAKSVFMQSALGCLACVHDLDDATQNAPLVGAYLDYCAGVGATIPATVGVTVAVTVSGGAASTLDFVTEVRDAAVAASSLEAEKEVSAAEAPSVGSPAVATSDGESGATSTWGPSPGTGSESTSGSFATSANGLAPTSTGSTDISSSNGRDDRPWLVGAIAGSVVGILLLNVGALVWFWLWRRRRRQRARTERGYNGESDSPPKSHSSSDDTLENQDYERRKCGVKGDIGVTLREVNELETPMQVTELGPGHRQIHELPAGLDHLAELEDTDRRHARKWSYGIKGIYGGIYRSELG